MKVTSYISSSIAVVLYSLQLYINAKIISLDTLWRFFCIIVIFFYFVWFQTCKIACNETHLMSQRNTKRLIRQNSKLDASCSGKIIISLIQFSGVWHTWICSSRERVWAEDAGCLQSCLGGSGKPEQEAPSRLSPGNAESHDRPYKRSEFWCTETFT